MGFRYVLKDLAVNAGVCLGLCLTPAHSATPKSKCATELSGPAQFSIPFVTGGGWQGDGATSLIDRVEGSPLVSELIRGAQSQEVVVIANSRFARNEDWVALTKWMADRGALAEEFADRSYYSIVRSYKLHGQPLVEADVKSTFGVTWAKFKQEDFEDKNLPERLADITKILPEEKTLGLTVTKYYDSKGNGIAIEYRTNSKDKQSPLGIKDEILAEMVRMCFEVIRDYPELYDKPIITAYADSTHRDLYRRSLGFEVQEETTPLDKPVTIEEDGQKVDWWVIQTTPRNLEAQLFKLKGHRTLSLNQPHPFKLWNGETAYSAADKLISFDANDKVTLATLTEEAEVAPGVFASADETVVWKEGKLVSVTKLSRPLGIKVGDFKFQIPLDSSVQFEIGHPSPRASLISARGESLIKIPGINVGASFMDIDYAQNQITLRVKESGDLGDGIFPKPNSDLVLERENGEWVVVGIERAPSKVEK